MTCKIHILEVRYILFHQIEIKIIMKECFEFIYTYKITI